MSKQIDERVVSMKFDNKQFEQGVSTTMSTLDKLKAKLNLSGASKGLDNISSSVKNVDMSPLAKGVETVRTKFSALEVMSVTALANITNSAVNAGKRIAESLTIAPVKDGFQEYEMTLNAVQTTMAGTGKTAEEVEKELKKLDEYADKTVYSTADMLNNLPKFTNAGVELEKATQAMIGIANATAHAGGDAGKASIAFYNLGQAIGTGYLSRMDYNSINNAGIATMEWKNAMVEAAIAQGTLTKVGEDSYQAGNKTLTLQQLFIDGLQEQWATTDVMMKVFGDYGDETTEIGKKAYSSAQDIKTFSMMMDSLKATAGTGWKDTWQIIFGGLDEAKEFWTELGNFISGVLGKMNDARNWLLEGALNFSKPWEAITEKLGKVQSTVDKVTESVSNVTDKLSYFQDVVNKVWHGDFFNADTGRYELLEKAGYDHRVVQDLVNKGLGYKLTVEDIEASHKKFGLTMDKTTESTKDVAAAVNNLSDEQLKAAGLTEEEIRLYRDLEAEAARTGVTIDELAKKMSETDGRSLLIDSFRNAGKGLIEVFKAMKTAWSEVFPPVSIVSIYKIIEAIHGFSEKLIMGDETADKLKRTLKGVFTIFKLVSNILGGTLKIAFKVINAVLGAFGLNILDVTAYIGDAIVAFDKWLEKHNVIGVAVEKVASVIVFLIKAIGRLISAFLNLSIVQTGIEKLKDGLFNLKDIGLWAIEGLKNGLQNGFTSIPQILIDIGKKLINAIKNILGIHSPSTVMFAIGGFIIAGLIGGLLSGSTDLGTTIKDIIGKIVEFFKGINWDKVFSVAISASVILIIYKIASAFNNLTKALSGFGNMLDSFGDLMDEVGSGIKRVSKAMSAKLRAEALKEMAIGILILAGAVFILSKIEWGDLAKAGVALIVLAGVLIGMSVAMDKLNNSSVSLNKGGLKIDGLKSSLVGIGIAVLLLAATIKIIGSMDREEAIQGFIGLVGIVGALSLFLVAYGKAMKGVDAKGIKNFGKMIRSVVISMFLLVGLFKLVQILDTSDLLKGSLFMIGFMAFVFLMGKIASIAGKHAGELGNMALKMTIAMGLMVLVCKLISWLDYSDMAKGALFALGFAVFVGLMAGIAAIVGDKTLAKLGGLLLSISVSMLLMIAVCKLVGLLSVSDMIKGGIFIVAFAAIIAAFVALTKIGKEEQMGKVAASIMAMAAAIGIMAAIAIVLGYIDTAHLVKGIVAVGLLGGLMILMVKSLKGAQNVYKSILMMAVTIGVMALAVAGLSFIDTTKLAGATLAMVVLMGMFTLMIKASSSAKSSITSVVLMTAVMVIMGGLLALLSTLDADAAFTSAISLSILMGVMTVLLLAISGIGWIIGKMGGLSTTINGIIGLTLLVVPLAAFGIAIGLLPNISDKTSSIQLLCGVLAAMTVLLIPLGVVGLLYGATGGVAFLGILALVAMAVPLAAFGFLISVLPDVSSAIPSIFMLLTVMTVLTDLLVKISLVAPLAVVGVAAIAAIVLVITAIGGLATAIGALVSLFPSLESFLDKGLDILVRVAGGIGEMMGAFIDGFLVASTENIELIGTRLSNFMTNLQPFLDGCKSVTADVVAGAGYIAAAIIALTVASLIQGITELLPFAPSLEDIGTNLSKFMMNAMPFLAIASTIDPAIMGGIKTLAEAILILTAGNLLDSIVSFITGESSLESFGSQLGYLGSGFRSFIDNIGDFSESEITTVTAAAEAVKILAEAADAIPNSGGWVGAIVGENDLGDFAEQFPKFGKGIRQFLSNIGTFSAQQQSTVTAAAEAVKSLAEAADSIPNSGGWVGAIVGNNDLDDFAAQFPKLGKGIKEFLNKIGTFNEAQQGTVVAAAEAVKTLASVADEIPNSGGLLADLVGDNDLGSFADQFPKVGAGLKSFTDKIGTFNNTKLATIQTAIQALWAIKDIANLDLDDFSDALPTLGSSLEEFGAQLISFTNKLSEVNTSSLTDGIGKLDKIVEFINAASVLANSEALAGASDIGTKIENVGTYISDGIKAFVEKVQPINNENLASTIQIAINAINAIVDLAEIGLADFTANLPAFGEAMKTFATKLVEFGEELNDINGEYIGLGTARIYMIRDLVLSINGWNTDGAVDNALQYAKNVEEIASIMISVGNKLSEVNNTYLENGKISVEKVGELVTKFADVGTDVILDSEGKLKAVGILAQIEAGCASMVKISDSLASVSKEAFDAAVAKVQSLETFVEELKGDLASAETSSEMWAVQENLAKIEAIAGSFKTASETLTAFTQISFEGTIDKVKELTAIMSTINTKLKGLSYDGYGKGIQIIGKLNAFIEQAVGIQDLLDTVDRVKKVADLAGAIKDAGIALQGVDSGVLNEGTKKIESVMALFEAMSGVKNSTVTSFSKAVKDAAAIGYSDFIDSFTGTEALSGIDTCVADMMAKFVSAIKTKMEDVSAAFKAIASTGVSALSTKVASFESAGKDLGSGLVRGIASKALSVYLAGYALGQMAVKGEKDGQKSNSPSKLTIQNGKWLGEGLVIGIKKMGKSVYNAGYAIGEDATGAISDSISRIASFIDSDMDIQPTIRPVLDLSDVQAGAGRIGGMLTGSTISVGTNRVGRLAYSMSGYGTTRGTDDVVTAIRGLRKDIMDRPQSVTNVNGVTYDDGTNVSNAVSDLVRAIRMERRS